MMIDRLLCSHLAEVLYAFCITGKTAEDDNVAEWCLHNLDPNFVDLKI